MKLSMTQVDGSESDTYYEVHTHNTQTNGSVQLERKQKRTTTINIFRARRDPGTSPSNKPFYMGEHVFDIVKWSGGCMYFKPPPCDIWCTKMRYRWPRIVVRTCTSLHVYCPKLVGKMSKIRERNSRSQKCGFESPHRLKSPKLWTRWHLRVSNWRHGRIKTCRNGRKFDEKV